MQSGIRAPQARQRQATDLEFLSHQQLDISIPPSGFARERDPRRCRAHDSVCDLPGSERCSSPAPTIGWYGEKRWRIAVSTSTALKMGAHFAAEHVEGTCRGPARSVRVPACAATWPPLSLFVRPGRGALCPRRGPPRPGPWPANRTCRGRIALRSPPPITSAPGSSPRARHGPCRGVR